MTALLCGLLPTGAQARTITASFGLSGTVQPSCAASVDPDSNGDADSQGGDGQGDGANAGEGAGSQPGTSGSIGMQCRKGADYSVQLVAVVCNSPSSQADPKAAQCHAIPLSGPGTVLSGNAADLEQTIPFDLSDQVDRELKAELYEHGFIDIVVTY